MPGQTMGDGLGWLLPQGIILVFFFSLSKDTFILLQGLEIVNPQAAEKVTGEENAKYFSNTSGFLSVGKKTT